MLDIGEFQNAYSRRTKLLWRSETLQHFLRNIFSEWRVLDHEGIKLGTLSHARNLVQIAGFKVELTTNLSDHLRFHDANRKVTIFHHASFLMAQRQYVINSLEA
jgi:hypothetical protein